MSIAPRIGRPCQALRRSPLSRAGLVAAVAALAAVTVVSCSPPPTAAAVPVPPPVRTMAALGQIDALTPAGAGSVWMAERSPADLVRVPATGTGDGPEHVALPGPASSLAARTDGSVWFTRPDAGTLGWTGPGGTVHELAVGGSPQWTTTDGAGGVWVLDPATATLDRRDVAGTRLTSVDVGAISPETVSVVLDPLATDTSGRPWVARRTSQTEVGHLRGNGSFVWSALPTASRSYPLALAAGPDGAMWGTAQSESGGVLFRADDTGATVVRTFPAMAVGALVTGPDGNLWTSLAQAGVAAAGQLVRIDPTGATVQQVTAPTGSGAAEHLAATGTSVVAALPNGSGPVSVDLPVAAAYQRLGGARSILGLPRSAEKPIPSGWSRVFAGGRLFWSPATGAHEVHGLILQKYLGLGADRSLLGLPVGDEYAPAGTTARASRFEHGTVLWSPRTGAHEVHGLILARYEQLGGPTGRLGLPASDELTVGPGVRESRFEHGVLRWSTSTGVLLLPAR